MGTTFPPPNGSGVTLAALLNLSNILKHGDSADSTWSNRGAP
jgi:hypothetical protein